MDSIWDNIQKNTTTIPETTSGQKLVSLDEARRFIFDCLSVSGASAPNAKAMADLLVESDYRGHYSHGMNRLEMYILDLLKGSTDGNAIPIVLNQTAATAWVDGQNALGAVVGNFCMDLAIKKAKEVGIAIVTAKGSNHFGIAGWYSLRAMKEGLIGLTGTNTSPVMVPTGSKDVGLGSNPISFAAPGDNGDSFVLDMATTAVALGKIEMQIRKNEPIPHGWAYDAEGKSTTDANVALNSGCLAPLGGTEVTSGYKGYGLAAMIEVLCGVLSGASYSNKVRKWQDLEAGKEANLGHFFIAIDPKCFAPGFSGRLSDMNNILRNLTPADPNNPVLVAGDPESIHMNKINQEGGIKYTDNQIETCNKLSEKIKVAPLSFIK